MKKLPPCPLAKLWEFFLKKKFPAKTTEKKSDAVRSGPIKQYNNVLGKAA